MSRNHRHCHLLFIVISVLVAILVLFIHRFLNLDILFAQSPWSPHITLKSQSINHSIQYYDFTARLALLYEQAYRELNITIRVSNETNKDFAIYPKRYYRNVTALLKEKAKVYDYCFIGGLRTDQRTFQNRKWILPIIAKNFGASSYLQFTDKITRNDFGYRIRRSFGSLFGTAASLYDYSLSQEGYVPKYEKEKERRYFDFKYFQIMSQCKFCLAPAGDVMYSMRFYEALMSKCIPIVHHVEETFRSKAESLLPYRYFLDCEDAYYRTDWVNENYELFLKYHTLENYKPSPGEINREFVRKRRVAVEQAEALRALTSMSDEP